MPLHEEYQLYVLPRVLESKKMAKSGRAKQKEADLEYNVAKQVEKMIRCDLLFHSKSTNLQPFLFYVLVFLYYIPTHFLLFPSSSYANVILDFSVVVFLDHRDQFMQNEKLLWLILEIFFPSKGSFSFWHI